MTKIKVPLFRLFIIPLLISFGSISPSFGEDSNIRVLEKKSFHRLMLVNRMCIGGYEFVVICKDNTEGQCNFFKNSSGSSLTQIITEEGVGKKC